MILNPGEFDSLTMTVYLPVFSVALVLVTVYKAKKWLYWLMFTIVLVQLLALSANALATEGTESYLTDWSVLLGWFAVAAAILIKKYQTTSGRKK